MRSRHCLLVLPMLFLPVTADAQRVESFGAVGQAVVGGSGEYFRSTVFTARGGVRVGAAAGWRSVGFAEIGLHYSGGAEERVCPADCGVPRPVPAYYGATAALGLRAPTPWLRLSFSGGGAALLSPTRDAGHRSGALAPFGGARLELPFGRRGAVGLDARMLRLPRGAAGRAWVAPITVDVSW